VNNPVKVAYPITDIVGLNADEANGRTYTEIVVPEPFVSDLCKNHIV